MGFRHTILAIEADGDKVLRSEARRLPAEHQPRRQEGLLGPRRLLRRRRRPRFLGHRRPRRPTSIDVVESKNPVETYHVTWSPDMKYLTFTRGPKFKGKNLKGLLPEFPGRRGAGLERLRGRRQAEEPLGRDHHRRQVVQAAELGRRCKEGSGEMMVAREHE